MICITIRNCESVKKRKNKFIFEISIVPSLYILLNNFDYDIHLKGKQIIKRSTHSLVLRKMDSQQQVFIYPCIYSYIHQFLNNSMHFLKRNILICYRCFMKIIIRIKTKCIWKQLYKGLIFISKGKCVQAGKVIKES